MHSDLLRPPPEQAEARGRCEAKQERDAAHRSEQRDHERTRRVLVTRRNRQEEGGDEGGRPEREHLHPLARHRRLGASRSPKANRDDDQQHRPVHEEADDVGDEPPGPRPALGGHGRKQERCRDEGDAQRVDEMRERTARRLEGHREAVEQVGEEEQEREVDPLHDPLGQVLRLGGQDVARQDHPRQRDERERCPEGGGRALAAPLAHANDRDGRDQDKVDDPDELDRLPHCSSWAGGCLFRLSGCDGNSVNPSGGTGQRHDQRLGGREEAKKRLRHAGWLLLAVELDRDGNASLLAERHVFDVLDPEVAADAAADGDR